MDYITSADAAKMWNISQRRVQVYCKDGKIEGAILLGNRWFIPKTALCHPKKVGRPSKKNQKGQ